MHFKHPTDGRDYGIMQIMRTHNFQGFKCKTESSAPHAKSYRTYIISEYNVKRMHATSPSLETKYSHYVISR